MIAATAGDVHPPLWYLITWLIGRLDPPAWAIRLPAALFSIASVYLFWLILQHFALSPRVRTLAMWLMVLSPFEIYYAQEGRMYALLGFLVLLSVWSIMERRWGVLFVAAVAMLYTQVYALFYLPSIALAGMILDRRDWLPINRSLALAGIMYLPWVTILQTQLTNIHQSYWIASLNIGGILSVLFGLFTGQGLPMAMQIPAMLVIFGWGLCPGGGLSQTLPPVDHHHGPGIHAVDPGIDRIRHRAAGHHPPPPDRHPAIHVHPSGLAGRPSDS
jgi:mannosyltransferase